MASFHTSARKWKVRRPVLSRAALLRALSPRIPAWRAKCVSVEQQIQRPTTSLTSHHISYVPTTEELSNSHFRRKAPLLESTLLSGWCSTVGVPDICRAHGGCRPDELYALRAPAGLSLSTSMRVYYQGRNFVGRSRCLASFQNRSHTDFEVIHTAVPFSIVYSAVVLNDAAEPLLHHQMLPLSTNALQGTGSPLASFVCSLLPIMQPIRAVSQPASHLRVRHITHCDTRQC